MAALGSCSVDQWRRGCGKACLEPQLVKRNLLVDLLEEEGYLTVGHWRGPAKAEGQNALITMLNTSRSLSTE